MKNHVLYFLTLLTFKCVLAEQHRAPCRQMDCYPLPSNCKYGVTLDRRGCCNVCVQGNGERCTVVPNTDGRGFVCIWSSVSDTSERINKILASLGFSPFFRAFFKKPEAFENHSRALNRANMLREHTIIQNIFHGPQYQATETNDEEYYKKYPTCGLFDYLTTEATDGQTVKAKKNGNQNTNSQLSNAHLIASTAGLNSKQLVSEVQEITKTSKDRKSKDVLQRTEFKVKKKDQEKFEAKSPLIKKLKQSSAQHEDKPTRGDKGLSTYAKQSQNINNNLLDNNNDKYLDELHHDKYNVRKKEAAIAGSKENKVIAMLEIGEESENGGKQKKEISKLGMKSTNSMMGIYNDTAQITSKDDSASQLLAGTISDFILLFLKRAMAMHSAHEDARGNLEIMESKVDPVAKLKYVIERKHSVSQQHQPNHKANNKVDDKSSFKDSSRQLQNGGQFTDSIDKDNHHGLFIRKIANDKGSARVEEKTMNTDHEDSDNDIKLFHKLNNLHSSEYENRQGNGIGKYDDNDKGENELLEDDWENHKAFYELNNERLRGYEDRQGIRIENHEDPVNGENELLEGDWGNNKEEKIKTASFINKSPSDGSLQLKVHSRKHINKNMLKLPAQKRQDHKGVDVSEEVNKGNKNILGRKKRDMLKPGQNEESLPEKYFMY